MVSALLDIKTPGGKTHRIDTSNLQTVSDCIAAVDPTRKDKSALLTGRGTVKQGADPIGDLLEDAQGQPCRLSDELPAG